MAKAKREHLQVLKTLMDSNNCSEKMVQQLKIDFKDVCTAFEQCTPDKHCIIDLCNQKIIYLNEEIETNERKKLDKIELNGQQYIFLPTRLSQDDLNLMRMFAYTLTEKQATAYIGNELLETLEKPKSFQQFKKIIAQHPKIEQQWFGFRQKQIQNQVINWLAEKNIRLHEQQLIPEIKISEISSQSLPKEVTEYRPVTCLDCRQKIKKTTIRYFETNQAQENRLIEHETARIMNEKFGVEKFSGYSSPKKQILISSQCPHCKSKNIIFDFTPAHTHIWIKTQEPKNE